MKAVVSLEFGVLMVFLKSSYWYGTKNHYCGFADSRL